MANGNVCCLMRMQRWHEDDGWHTGTQTSNVRSLDLLLVLHSRVLAVARLAHLAPSISVVASTYALGVCRSFRRLYHFPSMSPRRLEMSVFRAGGSQRPGFGWVPEKVVVVAHFA